MSKSEVPVIQVTCNRHSRMSSEDLYTVTVDEEEYVGASPDEAVGYAIRKQWLSGAFAKPVLLVLKYPEELDSPG